MDINPLWMFLPMVILIFTGIPMGLVLAFVGLVFGYLCFGDSFFGTLPGRIFGVQVEYVFVCLPMFIFMGNMLEQAGATEKLYDALHVVMGTVKGGLAYATIIIGTVFAAATGVIGASVTTMGLIAIPGMLKRGYNTNLTLGVVMASGTLGMLIPPSVMLVMFGSWAQLSVGRLFMAAIGPGLAIAACYAIYVFITCKRDPNAGPPIPKEELAGYTGAQKRKMTVTAIIPPIALIVVVMGTILTGIATPTEASGLGALGAIIIAAATKQLTFTRFKETTYRTARASGMVMLIAGGAYIFVAAFLRMGGAEAMKEILAATALGRWGTLAIIMLLLFVLGAFLDWFGILVILTPVFMPIIRELGFDPIWFGTMVAVNLQMSFLTPPFGYALFYIKGIVPILNLPITTAQIFKSIVPFIICIIIVMLIMCAAPQLALWIPSLIY